MAEDMIPKLFDLDQYGMMWDFYIRKLKRRKARPKVTKVRERQRVELYKRHFINFTLHFGF